MTNPPDSELELVFATLKAIDPFGTRFARAIRRAIDMLLDGPNTGRYRWDQLHKTEKTHCGTLVEINIQREFDFAGGANLDYSIAGIDVDCKFSQKPYAWMIPPEAFGRLLLVVWADDQLGRWSAGLVRAEEKWLREKGNRDNKSGLSLLGRQQVHWCYKDFLLPENALLRIPQHDVDAIFAQRSGQQRLNELVRRTLGRILTRNVICTVATGNSGKPTLDPLRRLRAGAEGARGQLQEQGIMVLGPYQTHREAAAALGLPVPGDSEFVCARVARRQPHHGNVGHVVADGHAWVVAGPDDPIEPAPNSPKIKR